LEDERSEHIRITASADFGRSSKTADGMRAKNALVDLRSAKKPLGHGRFDHRGTNRVNPNAIFSVFQNGGLRQRPDRPSVKGTRCSGPTNCPGHSSPCRHGIYEFETKEDGERDDELDDTRNADGYFAMLRDGRLKGRYGASIVTLPKLPNNGH
jgi:hypothetical protein